MTYRELLEEAKTVLMEASIEEWSNDAWLLFENIFSMSRTDYLFKQREAVSEDKLPDAEMFQSYIKRRAEHEPLQYITGAQNFMGYDFKVTPDVLIPRFDTEILVEQVLKHIKKTDKGQSIKMLDMCTGSGCIAVSTGLLAREAGYDIRVTGVDISEGALSVAEENAQRLGLKDIELLKSDLFSDVPVEKYDIIVSNPPYIQSEVIDSLSEEVRLHEPRLALDGMADGLYFYRRIAEESYDRLSTGGMIFFEIGYDQGEQVKNLLEQKGFNDICIIKDLAMLDRVVTARKD